MLAQRYLDHCLVGVETAAVAYTMLRVPVDVHAELREPNWRERERSCIVEGSDVTCTRRLRLAVHRVSIGRPL